MLAADRGKFDPISSRSAHANPNATSTDAGRHRVPASESLSVEQNPARSGQGWFIVIMVVTVLIVIVGLLEPSWAPRLALICLVLTATFVAANWFRSVLAPTAAETRSVEPLPADATDTAASDSPSTPLAVDELIHPHAPAGLSQRGMQYLRFVSSERLWASYGLNLAHQPHLPDIRSRVSPELWLAINYQLPPIDELQRNAQLARLLTEIERI